MMLLDVTDLNQHYGSAIALENIGFSVEERSCTAVLGRNGAGKSTLLRTLMGVMMPTGGTIRLNGDDITRAPSHKRARRGLAYVPQGREIFSDLSVGQNIEIILRNHRVVEPDALRDEIVALFPILGEMWNRRGGDLSGGQQQQLAIGRALASRPKILILDEPTEGIQPSIVHAIEDAIRSLKGRMAILLVEQYYDFAHSVADAYLVLDRGRVIKSGRAESMEGNGVVNLLTV